MRTEYVIWGKPPKGTDETLLLQKVQGEAITDRSAAEKLVVVLTGKHGCTDCRIQAINLHDPESINRSFTKAINRP